MGNGGGITACKGACDYSIDDDSASCSAGNGSCGVAELLEAEPSGFHDRDLIAATQKIKEILSGIPPDPEGRKLSFIHTKNGSLLAWMDHSGVATEGVTAKDDDATIAKALRLKGYATAGAGKA